MPIQHQITRDLEVLQHRASLTRQVRNFMEDRGVMEVDTPTLNRAGVTDPNISNLSTALHCLRDRPQMYLGTSPEFFMKRLLAAGSGSIYQVCKVYRDDPPARRHQPEFTMLEWYRTGFDHIELMGEIDELLLALGLPGAKRYAYRDVFREHLKIDPFESEVEELFQCALSHGLQNVDKDTDILLDFLFSHLVIPGLDPHTPFFIYHYPASQAALARISTTTPAYAERFELFYQGMELANGFHELTDPREQQQRFEQENEKRKIKGQQEIEIDHLLLAALKQGLPDCAGVAIGLDRLLMTILAKDQIRDVMSFPLVQE